METFRHEVLATLRGLRNGSFYGTKVRLPHAAVMTFLFRSGSLRDKVDAVMRLSLEHTRNLAAFVCVYKGSIGLGRVAYKALGLPMNPKPGLPAVGWHAFVAGCIGGALVWSKRTSVNNQIVMYLISRILVAVVKTMAEKGVKPFSLVSESQAFPWTVSRVGDWKFAVLCFAVRCCAVLC